ncbi:hypothetical protein [Arhodomonas sp. AD133]|uniref:hypothetical protein n=1 Tax=Arhodomonas sp. AD133 TaxID=3415009 RepID=UPI003EBDB6A9
MSARALLVTGLNSQPGWFLNAALAEHPAAVTAIGRRRPAELPANIAWRGVDLETPPRDLPAARVLLHMAPIWLLPPLLDALADAPPAALIAVSSSSARTKARTADSHERRLAERLAHGEQAAQGRAEHHGITCRILRPTLIYGHPSRGIIPRVRGIGRRLRVFPVPMAATGLRQPLHAADLAAALWQLVSAPEDTGASLQEIGGGERLTFGAMIRRILAGAVPPIRPLPVPAPLLRGVLRVAPGDVGPGMLDRLAQDQVADDRVLWQRLGLTPRPFQP